jgi:hypothetical protein
MQRRLPCSRRSRFSCARTHVTSNFWVSVLPPRARFFSSRNAVSPSAQPFIACPSAQKGRREAGTLRLSLARAHTPRHTQTQAHSAAVGTYPLNDETHAGAAECKRTIAPGAWHERDAATCTRGLQQHRAARAHKARSMPCQRQHATVVPVGNPATAASPARGRSRQRHWGLLVREPKPLQRAVGPFSVGDACRSTKRDAHSL